MVRVKPKSIYRVKSHVKTWDGFPQYLVEKWDTEGNQLTTYTVSQITQSSVICSCYAGNKPDCRHRNMVRQFAENARVDSGWMYNFDRHTWLEPINPEA